MRHALIANLQPRDCSRGPAFRGAEIVIVVRHWLGVANIEMTSQVMYHSCGMFEADHNPVGPRHFAKARRPMAAMAAIVLASVPAFAQKASAGAPAAEPSGVEIISSSGEPELHVGGVPFFVHAAQFDYFRIPPDLWARSLIRYRDSGINTIDLRIPWNWHEPRDAQFDFDGHTNPSRDLRGLLSLIAQMRFKLIVRPGPAVGDHWRNSGIPPWLLAYSEYGMSAADIQDGVAPPDAQLAAEDSNAAARGWLANEIHMTYARRWLTAVARELAPYSAKNMISISEPGSREGESQEKQIPGPLLFVALDDVASVPPGAEAPDLAKYLAELRGALARGGLDAISFLNVPSAAVEGLAAIPSASAPEDSSPVRLAGQWIFDPQASPLIAKPVSVNSATSLRESLLTTTEASSLSFLAHSLANTAGFPAVSFRLFGDHVCSCWRHARGATSSRRTLCLPRVSCWGAAFAVLCTPRYRTRSLPQAGKPLRRRVISAGTPRSTSQEIEGRAPTA